MPDTPKQKEPKVKHKPQPPPQTAAGAYPRRADRLRAVLGCVEDALEEHAAKAAASPGDWGFAGDLAEAESLLKRVLAHLGGADEQCLEQALDEMEGTGGGD